jgi:hypothetical protein
MKIDPPHQLGLGGVWRTLYQVGNILMVVAVVLRCHLLIVKIWGRLAGFCASSANVSWYCRYPTARMPWMLVQC